MSKKEFMEGLKQALWEQMDQSEARGHIQYYENYIDAEIHKGKAEEDVIAELGNPRLLVKSLVNVSENDSFYEFSQERKAQDKEEEGTMKEKFDLSKLSGNVTAIIGIAIAVVVVLVVLSVVTKIAWAVVKLLIPIVLLLVIVSFVWKNFIEKK